MTTASLSSLAHPPLNLINRMDGFKLWTGSVPWAISWQLLPFVVEQTSSPRLRKAEGWSKARSWLTNAEENISKITEGIKASAYISGLLSLGRGRLGCSSRGLLGILQLLHFSLHGWFWRKSVGCCLFVCFAFPKRKITASRAKTLPLFCFYLLSKGKGH